MLYLDFVINGVFTLWGPKIQFVKSGVRYMRGSLYPGFVIAGADCIFKVQIVEIHIT